MRLCSINCSLEKWFIPRLHGTKSCNNISRAVCINLSKVVRGTSSKVEILKSESPVRILINTAARPNIPLCLLLSRGSSSNKLRNLVFLSPSKIQINVHQFLVLILCLENRENICIYEQKKKHVRFV